MLKKDTE